MKRMIFLSLLLVTLLLSLENANANARNTPLPKIAPIHHVGIAIHESVVDGMKFSYHRLDLAGKKCHLMLTIYSSKQKPVTDAQVGYIVKGPDGRTQRVVAILLKDTYGRDVDFSKKGKYTIKVLILMGQKKLIDSFSYETR